jgi:hypothetical protein
LTVALFAAFLAALTVAYTVYQLIPIPASYWAGRLAETFDEHAEKPLPAWQALLLLLSGPLGRFAPANFVKSIQTKLYWAQLQGEWKGWEGPTFLAMCVVAGVGGFLGGLALLGGEIAAIVSAGVAFYVPIVLLNSKSSKAVKSVRRGLPEVTQLLATEVATGSSLEQAMERVARGRSALSLWFRDTLRLARGRALFSPVGTDDGMLRQQARASGIVELHSLAVQLDSIYRQGTGGKELLSALAIAGASEYLAEVDRQAEALPTKLVTPSTVFFFMPFTIAVILPVALPLLEMFG